MTYQIADQRHPFMGLDNKICKDDFDLIGTHRYGNLERKDWGNEIISCNNTKESKTIQRKRND